MNLNPKQYQKSQNKSSQTVINLDQEVEEVEEEEGVVENNQFNNNELDDFYFQQLLQNQQIDFDHEKNSSVQLKSKNVFNQSKNEMNINTSLIESNLNNSFLKQKREELIQSFANKQKIDEKKMHLDSSQFSEVHSRQNLNIKNQKNNQDIISNSSNMLDSDNIYSSSLSSENKKINQQQQNQGEPENKFKKIFKDIIVFIITLTFGGIIILIFYSFLKIIIDQTREISKPHYEIVKYNKTDEGISVFALCKRCQSFYKHVLNPIADTIQLDISYENSTSFSINLSTQNFTEWTLPNKDPFPHFPSNKEKNSFNDQEKQAKQFFVSIKEKPLEIGIFRVSTNEKIFMISSSQLIYSFLYKEYTFQLPSTSIYGIGHNNANFTLTDSVYTLWNQKLNQSILPLTSSNSFHPVFLIKESSNAFHLIYIRSSTPLDAFLQNNLLTIKMVGGTINLIVFIGNEKPQKVVQEFHSFLGGYTIPPLWSLGTHYKISKMKNLTQIIDFKNLFASNKIELDVLWFDSSIFRDNKSFFFNKQDFNITIFKELTKDIQLIPEIQPGIKIDQDSIAYNLGIQRDIFLKRNDKNDLVFGKNSYQQSTHYPDYFNPQIQDYTNDVNGYLFQDIFNKGCYLVDNEITDYSSSSSSSFIVARSKQHSLPHRINSQQQIKLDFSNQTYDFKLPYFFGNHSIDSQTLSKQ